MAKLKVEFSECGNTQYYGTYNYSTDLGAGSFILRKKSARKMFADVISRNRSETCIKEAIKNYKAEIKARNKEL